MTARSVVPFLLTAVAVALGGTAHSQMPSRVGVGPSNPDRTNQQLETMQQIRLLEEQRLQSACEDRRRAYDRARQIAAQSQPLQETDVHTSAGSDQTLRPALVAKFMEAVKCRRHLFAHFDEIVFQGNAPVTPDMIALMADSPYAADIAYFLGRHPDQAAAIAQMRRPQASLAVRQLEETVTAENVVRP